MRQLMLALGALGLMAWTTTSGMAVADDKSTTATTSTQKATKNTAARATASTSTVKKAAAPSSSTTPSQIAAAKAAGQVWVNTSTGVWHTSSSKWYGTTKQGKFMSVTDATKAGYHAAKGGE